MILSMPLTSPTIINSILYKKSSLFYDPTFSLSDNLNIPNITFIRDKLTLKKFIENNLKKLNI